MAGHGALAVTTMVTCPSCGKSIIVRDLPLAIGSHWTMAKLVTEYFHSHECLQKNGGIAPPQPTIRHTEW